MIYKFLEVPIVEGTFWSLQMLPIILFTFDSTLLRCSSNFSFLSSCIPKCFWKLRTTGMLLKYKRGWDVIDLLREISGYLDENSFSMESPFCDFD